MNMLNKLLKQLNAEEKPQEVEKKEVIKEQPVETKSEAIENLVQMPSESDKIFKVEFGGRKYKVHAKAKEEAVKKVKDYNELNEVEFTVRIEDIINEICKEINRIVTVAHPEVVTNSYDRWVAVLTEELGEIVHEINDAYEGKKANKNTFVECIQLASATILLANKFANEHPKMFEKGKKDE